MNYKLKLGALLIVFASFVYFVTHLDVAVLSPKGAVGLEEKELIETAFFLMLLVVVPVYIMIFWFSRRYRADNPAKHVKYAPDWADNSALEFTWWAIPTAIIFTLATITWKSTHELDPYKPLESKVPPITIQVVALNWKWLFIYPDQHVATVGYLEIPVGTPVNFMITADAPMNSFWIPELGGQIYAMSGMVTQLNLIADNEGDYKGSSANFSGDGFSGMKFITHAVSKQNFDTWAALAQHSDETLSKANYPQLALPSKDVPPATYVLTDPDLYNDIVMKYMAPNTKIMDMTSELNVMAPQGNAMENTSSVQDPMKGMDILQSGGNAGKGLPM